MKEKGKLIESPEIKPHSSQIYTDLTVRCHGCGGALIWRYFKERDEIEVFHDCTTKAESPRQPSELDKELGRWQKAIYELCKKAVGTDGDFIIDGGGCDSGDALDFTLTEIGQAFSYLKEREAESPRKPSADWDKYLDEEVVQLVAEAMCGLNNPLWETRRHVRMRIVAILNQAKLTEVSQHPVPAPDYAINSPDWCPDCGKIHVDEKCPFEGGHPEPAKGGTE